MISDFPAAVRAANLEAFDLIIAAFAEPRADATLSTGLGAFASHLPAVVAEGHALGKSVIVSIGAAYPAALADNFAASPALSQTFSNNIVAFLEQHDLDGVNIDYEFPANAGAARTDFSLLMHNRSWSAFRSVYFANKSAFDVAIDADSLEVLIDHEWFTSPVAMKRKMSALLDPAAGKLAGGPVICGVGWWGIGHEHASAPDLSTALAE